MSRSAVFSVFLVFLLIVTIGLSANLANAQEGLTDVTGQECIEGGTRPCGSNIGECEEGTRTCVNGEWSECTGGVEPEEEVCGNQLDDDCDGAADECITELGPILIISGILLMLVMGFLVKMGF